MSSQSSARWVGGKWGYSFDQTDFTPSSNDDNKIKRTLFIMLDILYAMKDQRAVAQKSYVQ